MKEIIIRIIAIVITLFVFAIVAAMVVITLIDKLNLK